MLYIDSVESVAVEKLAGFFVGWPNPPTPQVHLESLRNSDEIVLAIDGDSHQVVGFITAITDKTLNAHIPLLEVLPEFQGRGIGRELVKRMLDKLSGLYAIDLICDPKLQPFYAKLGLKQAHGMMARNYENQSGMGRNER